MQKATTPLEDQPYALVADDDVLLLMDLSQILTDAGFRPLEAHTLEMALDMLTDYGEALSLIFADVQLRGMRDGFELAKSAAILYPDIKILVASGVTQPNEGDLPKGRCSSRSPLPRRLSSPVSRSCSQTASSLNH